MPYLWHVVVVIVLSGTCAAGLAVVVSHMGALVVCQAALASAGAYAAALLSCKAGWPVEASLPVSVAVGAALAAMLVVPIRRLRGEYLILASLALQELWTSFVKNADSLTGGAMGIMGIPRLSALPRGWNSPSDFLLFALPICGVAIVGVWLLVRGPLGRVLRVTRDDFLFAEACGIRSRRAMLGGLVVCGALAGLSGALSATYYSYLSPDMFDTQMSISFVAAVVLGGRDRFFVPILVAAGLAAVPEFLRVLGMGGPKATNVQQMLVGLAMVAVAAIGWGPESRTAEHADEGQG